MPKQPNSSRPVLSEDGAARKKSGRWKLYLPFVVLLILVLAVCGYWLAARVKLTEALDARAEALRAAGYTVDLEGRRVSGFPFRMKLAFSDARLAAPSGWAVEAPGLQAEAYLHDLGHWVLVAPRGLAINRPRGGGLEVKGQALRASLAGLGKPLPRIVLEGNKLAFSAPAGARPFSLSQAERAEVYFRPDPESPGGGRFLIRLQGGRTTPGSTLGKVAPNQQAVGVFEGRLKAIASFKGKDWASAVDAWRGAAGEADELHLTFTVGTTGVESGGGALAVGRDGRLEGAMPLKLKEPGKALGVLGDQPQLEPTAPSAAAAVAAARAQGSSADLNLVFQAGVVTLGPVKIGPSPRVR
jgi:hypothetical protein